MRRKAMMFLIGGSLLAFGSWWSRRPPAWLDQDPLASPFGLVPTSTGPSSTAPGEILDQPPVDAEHPIELATADQATLQRLPGVGPVLARRILVQRDSLGGLADAGQFDAVPGIGPKLLARLLPLVRFPSSASDSLRAR